MLRGLAEQVPFRPDERLHAHHDRLADRVDRRVRDLREELLEVGVEQRMTLGEHSERRVVPHRPDRLLGVRSQRSEHHLHVFLRVAKGQLEASERLRERPSRMVRQIGQPHRPAFEPVAVRPARRNLVLDLVVRDDPARLEVDEEELPRLEAALALDLARRHVEDAGLGREHDPAVLRLEPAAGPKAVPVERRADHAAVRERERRGPVPRLDQAAVVGVEALERTVSGRPGGAPPASSSSARAGVTGPRARAARGRCRRSPSPSRPAGRPGAPSPGRRRTAPTASCDSRAPIQFALPRIVLNSPLCATNR